MTGTSKENYRKPVDNLEQFFDHYLSIKLFYSDEKPEKKQFLETVAKTVRDSLTEYFAVEHKILYPEFNKTFTKNGKEDSPITKEQIVGFINESFKLVKQGIENGSNGLKEIFDPETDPRNYQPIDSDFNITRRSDFISHVKATINNPERIKPLIPSLDVTEEERAGAITKDQCRFNG